MKETIHAHGHEHVQATHQSTFEVTSDDYLTPAGDCILGIKSDCVPARFDSAFVSACQNATATITARIEVAGIVETVTGRGDPALTFDSDRSLVGRTSEYVDGRTVLVEADAAAADLDRDLVAALAAGADLVLTLEVT